MKRIFTACCLAAILSGGVGCVPQRGAQLSHDLKTAERQHDAEKLLSHAVAFRQVGDLTRAEQYLNAARDAGAPEEKVLPILLSVYLQDGRYRDAIAQAEDSLKRRPTNTPLRFLLATLYTALGEHIRAKTELEHVVTSAPENAKAHYLLAVILRDEFGEIETADTHFRAYLKLDPHGTHQEEAEASLLTRIQ